jgi:hypothetical protein
MAEKKRLVGDVFGVQFDVTITETDEEVLHVDGFAKGQVVKLTIEIAEDGAPNVKGWLLGHRFEVIGGKVA